MLMTGIKVQAEGEESVVVRELVAPFGWLSWKKVIKWLGDLPQEKLEKLARVELVELEVKEVEK